jgi:hypothetical protein
MRCSSRGDAPLSTARIHQHPLPMSQTSLESAVAAFPFLLNFLRRLGVVDGDILLDDGPLFIVFRCRDKVTDKRFQNCLPYWVGKIFSIENRAQGGLNSFGLLLSLFRSYLSTAQSFPKRQNGSVSRLAVISECCSYLGLEGLVVSVENSREVPIGAVGRGILKNESAARAPRRNRKGDFTGRAIGQRMSNCHFDALVPK